MTPYIHFRKILRRWWVRPGGQKYASGAVHRSSLISLHADTAPRDLHLHLKLPASPNSLAPQPPASMANLITGTGHLSTAHRPAPVEHQNNKARQMAFVTAAIQVFLSGRLQ